MKLLELGPPLPTPPPTTTYTYWTGCFASKRNILALLGHFQTQESSAFPSPSLKSHNKKHDADILLFPHTSSPSISFKAANDTRKINAEKWDSYILGAEKRTDFFACRTRPQDTGTNFIILKLITMPCDVTWPGRYHCFSGTWWLLLQGTRVV